MYPTSTGKFCSNEQVSNNLMCNCDLAELMSEPGSLYELVRSRSVAWGGEIMLEWKTHWYIKKLKFRLELKIPA